MAESVTENGGGNNIVKKGMQKAMDIISDNKSGDWRKTLSGALDEQHLVWALVVMTIFYTGYTIGSAYHDNSEKDEDFITRNCTCNPNQRNFYISWSAICYALWGIIHMLIFISCIKKCDLKGFFCNLLHSCCKNKNQTACPPIACSSHSNDQTLATDEQTFCNQHCTAFCYLFRRIKKCIVDDDEIHRYEYYLWTQYYELYTIGITSDIKIFNSENVNKIFKDHLNKNEKESNVTDTFTRKKKKSNKDVFNKQRSAPDCVALTKFHHIRECKDWFSYVVHYTIFVTLHVIRFSSQLTIVPLLMIQMLDTYAFLCLTADNYCTRAAQYDLHLDQTLITFGFYCSLLFSYLTTIMLRWIPRPNYYKGTK